MPWRVSQRDGKFCVVKIDSGEVVACHPTREAANAQRQALYANTDYGLQLALQDFELHGYAQESDVNRPGGSHNLKSYWTKGAGAAKIRWGTDGSFARCVTQLGKYVKNPQGLCAEYHKAATGEWPAEKGVKSSMNDTVETRGDEDLEFATSSDDKKRKKNHTTTYATGDGDEPWDGVLTVEGVESGDGRLFGLGSLDWEKPPQPLMYQPANVGGHNGSFMVGEIQSITRHGSRIRGKGTVFGSALAGEHGEAIRHMMKTGGVSVDVDKVKDADVEMVYADDESGDGTGNMFAKPETTIFHRGRIRGATLVAFPAFVEAKLAFTNDDIVVAHGSHNQDSHGNRYGADAVRPDWSYGDKFDKVTTLDLPDRVEAVRISKGDDVVGYVVRHPTRGERYVKSDRTGSTPGGIFDLFDAANKLMTDPPQTASVEMSCGCEDEDPLVASVHTITIPNLPKAEWFNEPTDVKVTGALTITDEGRVFGVVAPSDTTHRSVKTRVPRSLDFSRFHKGETIVEGGGRVVTGVITAGCPHAPTENYGTLQRRMDHYDNSCSVLANVRVGYGRTGAIWVAGALNPGADPKQVAQALGCALSLDVQPHPDRPGIREFIAAHLVPVPGFPQARTQASVTYEDGMLVASSVPVVRGEGVRSEVDEVYFNTYNWIQKTKQLLLASAGMDPESRKREIMSELEDD